MSDNVPTQPDVPLIFGKIPLIKGPLFEFEKNRPGLIKRVTEKSLEELIHNNGENLDLMLGESLYAERFRIKRARRTLFTRGRLDGDRALWGGVQAGLLKSSTEVERQGLLQKVVGHYTEEIGGHFDHKVYRLALTAVPWGFNWLLNAASVKRFLPWGMTQSLQSRINIYGEVASLQKLSERGTILLVPTHQSNIDSVMIGYLIYLMSLPPFSYGAGLNLFSNPLLSFFMSNLGAYTVDRQKTNDIYKLVLKNYSTNILRAGVHSIFFPGGGRSRSGAIESKLKLGLLGTGLDAQLANLREGKPKPNIYVVPIIISYNFVLEAGSLIEDYLAEAGKHRYIMMDDESWQPLKVIQFFWKLFSSRSGILARVGKPLDIFGNFVDEEGRSLGPNGTTIDPVRWLTTRGELRPEPQRDREYTHLLGERIIERFHRENTVLCSHLVAFVLFETLRKKYPELDLYRFLRLSLAQRSMPYPEFIASARGYYDLVSRAAERGEFYLSQELKPAQATDQEEPAFTQRWVSEGVQQLGLLHSVPVVKIGDGAIWTGDMNLLYYYRNRLSGYSLSLLGEAAHLKGKPGKNDEKGFLA